MDINHKTAIITGGASGLGEATVRRFHASGANIAIFDMDLQKGSKLADDLGSNAKAYEVDVTQDEGVCDAVTAVVHDLGVPHILCNYAGIATGAKIWGKKGPMDMDVFRSVLDVNLTGTVLMCRSVVDAMMKSEPFDDDGQRGVIINTSSIAYQEGQVGQIPYSASKAAIWGMALPMARDLAACGIRVNTLAPGLIHTPLFDSIPPDFYESLKKQCMFPNRLGKPDEIAKAAQFLVENDFMNAECIRIDSGTRMQAR